MPIRRICVPCCARTASGPRDSRAAKQCDEIAPFHVKVPVEAKAYQKAALCVTAKLARRWCCGSFSTEATAPGKRVDVGCWRDSSGPFHRRWFVGQCHFQTW